MGVKCVCTRPSPRCDATHLGELHYSLDLQSDSPRPIMHNFISACLSLSHPVQAFRIMALHDGLTAIDSSWTSSLRITDERGTYLKGILEKDSGETGQCGFEVKNKEKGLEKHICRYLHNGSPAYVCQDVGHRLAKTGPQITSNPISSWLLRPRTICKAWC